EVPSPNGIRWKRTTKSSAARTSASLRSCAKLPSSLMYKKSGGSVGVAPAEGGSRGETLMDAVTHLAPTVGIVAACDFLGVARASFYRQRPVLGPPVSPTPEPALPREQATPARSLSEAEREAVLQVLHEERFQDRSPAAVQATLLDEGQYLCSTRTMYRILEQ